MIVRFDREFAALDADAFATRVLAGALGARHVSVGANFHYGHGARGNPEKLAEEGPRLGFDVHVEPAARGRRRAGLVVAGARADRGRRRWSRRGAAPGPAAVGRGRGRARRRPRPRPGVPDGQPGARRRARRCPAVGVYAGTAHLPGSSHAAAISVGYNPTFTDDRSEVRVEAYLLDFDGDIYGSPIRLDLTHRLRDELRYDSVDALLEQLHRDVGRGPRAG